jgi:hypothetical protein
MSEFAEGYAVGQGTNGYGNNCGWGGDGWWILLLLLCGWGNGNGWAGNGGNNMLGYELGRVATTNDVASGFSTSAIMGNINDIMLTQQSGFANVQQTLCQGFNGVNQAIGDCCCRTQSAIADVKYANERNTCDIIQAGNANTQRILDYLNCQEMNNLRNENQTLRLQASQSAQNAYLIDQLRPTARPAYITCSPFDSAYGNGRFGGRGNGCDGF